MTPATWSTGNSSTFRYAITQPFGPTADLSALQALIDGLQAQFDFITRTVFVTSATFDGNLGGFSGANVKCQTAADGPSSIVPIGTYKAWISDGLGYSPTASPNFKKSGLTYVLPDGSPVAGDYTVLTGGTLVHSINIDETGGAAVADLVWTNTTTAGTQKTGVSSDTCSNWTSASGAETGRTGSSVLPGFQWTDTAFRSCDNSHRLYCFQQ